MVFEDAVSGVTSASRAGVGRIIGVYGDSSKALLEATGVVDCCVPDFENIQKIIPDIL